MTSRRLIVMRHAKAEPFAATDHARALTDRGARDAAEAGSYLGGTSMAPDHAIVSSAVRAVATWEAVSAASGSSIRADVDGAVYTGSPQVVLDLLRLAPEDAERVIFVGHNPTVSHLVHLLDDGEGDPSVLGQLLRGYPPSALTVLDVAVPWADLAHESCRVVDFHVGRG